MKRTVWASVVAVVALTALVVAGARILLIDDTPPADNATGESAGASSAPDVPARPDCPDGAIGGVDLPCLGGRKAGQGKEIAVVNVWAWWCAPCREELPAVADFARAHPEYEVVGVHADGNAANGAALLNDLGVDLPSYQDDANRFAGTLGLPGVVPVTVVLRGGERVAVFAREFTSAGELADAVAGVL